MAADAEILALWKDSQKAGKGNASIVEFYKKAHKAGREGGLIALGEEIVEDATIESAIITFGWGRGSRASVITARALVREALRIANENLKRQ